MARIGVIAALSVGTLAASAAGAQAQFSTRVSQDVSASCQNIQSLQSGYVTAECRDVQGRYRWSSIYVPYCRSDLANQNGVLACAGTTATVGGYVAGQSTQQTSPAAAIIGALAGVFLGTGTSQPLYAPGARYPVWGEPGYGDPQRDPRFGQEGWGYGSRGEWVPIAQRQQWLERRIAQGESQGSLTRTESASLRRELTELDRLERRYNRSGLSNTERADLDQRFDALSLRIRMDRQDSQDRWANINQRQIELDARIDAGVRDRSLTAQEAARLRADFQAIARLEANYRQGGLSNTERADLDQRFDALSSRIQGERGDRQDGRSNINQRQAELKVLIDAGARDRSLNTRETARLRADLGAVARAEAGYRSGGLNASERADLDRRLDDLERRLQAARQ